MKTYTVHTTNDRVCSFNAHALWIDSDGIYVETHDSIKDLKYILSANKLNFTTFADVNNHDVLLLDFISNPGLGIVVK